MKCFDDINTYNINGFVGEGFSRVKDAFERNFASGIEAGGAAFAVYHKGNLVIDIYGGFADPIKKIPWRENTMSIYFSITKNLATIALAMLIDKGKAKYEDKVCKYWPEFAANNKDDITIKQLVQHEAGLPYDNQVITVQDILDHRSMSKKLENMSPLWTPGTQCGYHALTYGFLLDQLVRRLDEKQRGVVLFIEEEVLHKYDIEDLHIGLKDEKLNERVAVILEPTEEQLKAEGARNPEALKRYNLSSNHHNEALYEMWPWIKIPDYNKLENRCLPMMSNMGIGTARALAKVHSLIVENKLLSNEMMELISEPQLLNKIDLINGYAENKGFGWQYNWNKFGYWNYGHSGYGGQNVRMDTRCCLSYAYLCNWLKAGDSDILDSFSALQDALYECISSKSSN